MTFFKRHILPVIFILSGTVCCLGQSIKLTGRVVDEVNRKIETASVIILRQSDRQILGSTICDSLGTFTLNCKCKGIPVLVQTRHIAFQTDSISLLLQKDTTISIHLKPFQYVLEDVVVKAKRAPLQYKNGDVIVNVENFIDSGTIRSVDMLRKLPGVFINEQNKQVLLNGKPVELQIDGRTQPLSFEILKALPPQLLDQVVLIPNKRAEHDGDAGNAIIDLKTKKKSIDGYVGSVDGNYGMYRGIGMPGEAQGSFFAMLMKKDFYLNLSIQTEANTDEANVYDSTYYGSSKNYITNKMESSDRPWATLANLNLSWNVSRGHRISANLYAFSKKWDELTVTNGFDQRRNLTRYDVKSTGKRWNASGNVEYESSDSLPFKLKISYGYIDAGENTQNTNQHSYPDDSRYVYDYSGKQRGEQHIVKSDFRKTFADDKWTLNAGLKFNFGKTKDDSKYLPESENLNNELFHYSERIFTAYLSGGWRISQKIYANAGVRAEHTDYDLSAESTATNGDNRNWNFLPSAGIFFNLHRHYNTSLSLTSSIVRPIYNYLSSGEKWYNDRYYSRGNPFLQPQKDYTLTWGNTIFQKLNLNLSGQYTKDLFEQVLLDKGKEITESTYMNCCDSWAATGNISLPMILCDGKFSFNLMGNGSYGKYKNIRNGFTIPSGRNRIANASASLYAEYWFSKQYRFKVYVTSEYTIVSKSFQNDVKPYAYANIGVLYKCMKNTPLYIFAFANDVFNSNHMKMTSYYDANVRYFHPKEKSQGYFIGLSYNFHGGKDLKREGRKEDVNAVDKRFQEK